MRPLILDTSALLTLIEDEDGAERVEQALRTEEAFLPWPVLLETYYVTCQERGQTEADRRYALVKRLRATILWHMEESIVLTAARLKADHRISLADAIIASFAIRHACVLMHKDPEFDSLSAFLEMQPLPYK